MEMCIKYFESQNYINDDIINNLLNIAKICFLQRAETS